VVSPLTIKVIAGAAALIAGIFGGAYVAGAAGADVPTPALSPATPSRVASPTAVGQPRPAVKAERRVPASTPKHGHDDVSKRAKHHQHGDDNNN
jgi:hypothetical protein